jgi:hypothetical protein
LVNNAKIPPTFKQTRKFRPLTDEVVRGHLVENLTIGIYPLLQDETCWWGFAADIIAFASYIALTALLYELFKPVNRSLSHETCLERR